MSYEKKLQLAFNELEAAGIWKWNYNPPLHQWARKAGCQLRPPCYVPPWRNFCVRFAEFFILFYPLMFLFGPSPVEASEFNLLFESLVASSFYSVAMCLYYLWTFKRCELSHWDKL
ncbi:DUF6404 family protein [Vibrio sp. VPAP30]|uniref:DUF6404 family protein n=1 Tax=Vibrio sp. VPAP30 TaxID=1647102 RepID=UPI000658CA81|nr:DUF6404 family protein [Vibrio sp. VPAP30]KLN63766.1 hypothetical protein ZX61_19830 [Vibrio sp. VPAP30]